MWRMTMLHVRHHDAYNNRELFASPCMRAEDTSPEHIASVVMRYVCPRVPPPPPPSAPPPFDLVARLARWVPRPRSHKAETNKLTRPRDASHCLARDARVPTDDPFGLGRHVRAMLFTDVDRAAYIESVIDKLQPIFGGDGSVINAERLASHCTRLADRHPTDPTDADGAEAGMQRPPDSFLLYNAGIAAQSMAALTLRLGYNGIC